MSKFSFALFVSLMNFLTRLGCQIIMYTKATRAGQEQKAKKSSSVAYFINDGVLGREREKALFGLCTKKKNVYSFSRGSFVFRWFLISFECEFFSYFLLSLEQLWHLPFIAGKCEWKKEKKWLCVACQDPKHWTFYHHSFVELQFKQQDRGREKNWA